MYTQTSYHVDSLRRSSAFYFRQAFNGPTKYRPALNVKKLLEELKKATSKEEDVQGSPSRSSRKRAASGTSSAENSPKRRRTSPLGSVDSEASEDDADEIGDGGDNEDDSDDSDWSPDNWEKNEWGKYPYSPTYPLVEGSSMEEEDSCSKSDADRTRVPVFRHVFELQYTKGMLDGPEKEKDYVDDHIAQKRGWDKEESELADLIKQIGSDASEPTTIELGRLWLHLFRGRYVALSDKPGGARDVYGESMQTESNKWFLLVPSMPWPDEVDFDADDYTPFGAHQDMFTAFEVLGRLGRAVIKTHLRLIVLPSSTCDTSQDELPFLLQFETTASLVVPAIFEPIRGGNQRDIASKEDVQRRLLSFLFPPSDSPDVPAFPESGSIDIPFFYSVLNPAPSLLSAVAEKSLQPKDLLPTLLPFQRRSVGWMLEREGKSINSEGEVVLKSTIDDPAKLLPLFWDKIELPAGDVWYIDRLTGLLSQEIPEEDCPPGGILAEEPGLGKTLECIALIMLNPAPGRNPDISHWDDRAEITLKEIKVISPH